MSSACWQNEAWSEVSTGNESVICSVTACPETFGSRLGAYWARFGAFSEPESSRLTQRKEIPPEARYMDFDLMIPLCDTAEDVLQEYADEGVELPALILEHRGHQLDVRPQVVVDDGKIAGGDVDLGARLSAEQLDGLAAGEVATATHQQGLVHDRFEMTVRRFHVTVLVRLANVDALRLHLVVIHQIAVACTELTIFR